MVGTPKTQWRVVMLDLGILDKPPNVAPKVWTPKDHQETKFNAKAKSLFIVSLNSGFLSIQCSSEVEETPSSNRAGYLLGVE